jgi:hypothetical protein
LLVLFGLGTTVAAFLSAVPWLVTLSHRKTWVFAISGILIAGNFVYVYLVSPQLQARGQACSLDTPEVCAVTSRLSRAVLWVSAVIYAIGSFLCYVLGSLLAQSM